jgi:tetratricopeptide (TPR) repeat protein
MSSSEITELRKAGKLEEALQMANDALEEQPDNIWNKRAAAWVHYSYLKKFSQPDTYDIFTEYLQKIKELALPEDEKTVFDNCAWQIGSMVFGLQKPIHPDYRKVNELFSIIREFHFTKPSKGYSFLYKAFHKGYQGWGAYLDFADWWGFDNFKPEDYLKEEYNGKKTMSMVEKAYIGYSKKLLEGDPLDTFGHQRAINTEKIHAFLPQLDSVIGKHPDYQYPPYFKAKLLLAVGDADHVLSAFLPFARQKRNDFWVWDLMAEIFAGDKDKQFACYCKALSLKTPEDFLVKLRQVFASILVKRQMYDEAKTEIQTIITTREKQGWKLPPSLKELTEQEWYKTATAKESNHKLYSEHLKVAEEELYKDIPEEIVVVEFVNKNKRILNFVKNKKEFGFFNYSDFLNRPQIGDILRVRLKGKGQQGFFTALTAKKAEADLECEAIKHFNGTLEVISPVNFGFVDDVYLEPKIIQSSNLTSEQTLTGKAVLSFNKKKNEWGWKAIEVG